MAQLELLDPQIDVRHRSYHIAVQGEELPVLRPRVPDELMRIDERWIPMFVNFEFTVPYGFRHDIGR